MIGRLETEIERVGRHVRILHAVAESEPIGIHRLADHHELPAHKVRYSLRVLENEGLLTPTNEGARLTDDGRAFLANVNGKLAGVRDALDAIEVLGA